MAIVRNTVEHGVVLTVGYIAAGEERNIDPELDYEAQLIDAGILVVVDGDVAPPEAPVYFDDVDIQRGTSNLFSRRRDTGERRPVPGHGGVGTFIASHDYIAGDVIRHGDALYYATSDFTSADTFDEDDWTPISGPTGPTGPAGVLNAATGFTLIGRTNNVRRTFFLDDTDPDNPVLTAEPADFLMTDLVGLVALYDAGDLALANDDPVTAWPDSAPAGFDLASIAADPVFKAAGINGEPSVLFNGDALQNTDLALDQPNTLLLVVKAVVVTGATKLICDGITARQYVGITASEYGFSAGNENPVGVADTDPHILEVFWNNPDDGVSRVLLDGVQVHTADYGAASLGGWRLGAYGGGMGVADYNGHIALAAHIDGELTGGERTAAYAYLLDRFGITP